jgi:hypothetical protein
MNDQPPSTSNPVGEFFSRLAGIHLLFWDLSFQLFDVIAIFVVIVASIGASELMASFSASNTGKFAILQFLIAVPSYVFCLVWRPFRPRYVETSNNLVCLVLSISFLAALFAFIVKFLFVFEPLRRTVGWAIARFNEDLKAFAWDTNYPISLILFLLAYGVVLINTRIVNPGGLSATLKSWNMVALIFSFALALLACLNVTWPILESFDMASALD